MLVEIKTSNVRTCQRTVSECMLGLLLHLDMLLDSYFALLVEVVMLTSVLIVEVSTFRCCVSEGDHFGIHRSAGGQNFLVLEPVPKRIRLF